MRDYGTKKQMLTAEFCQTVYDIADQVPRGKVTTYGDIATLLGVPQCSRLVGRALKQAPAHHPCHRVVNTNGRTVPGWAEQVILLKAEGVTFKPNGCVEMKLHRWNFQTTPTKKPLEK